MIRCINCCESDLTSDFMASLVWLLVGALLLGSSSYHRIDCIRVILFMQK